MYTTILLCVCNYLHENGCDRIHSYHNFYNTCKSARKQIHAVGSLPTTLMYDIIKRKTFIVDEKLNTVQYAISGIYDIGYFSSCGVSTNSATEMSHGSILVAHRTEKTIFIKDVFYNGISKINITVKLKS